jgi:hypothetical protein
MFANFAEPQLKCELQNGIPTVGKKISSYYYFSQDGRRMLVISRKKAESIIVDNSINIVVLDIADDEVKLGIICPDDTAVYSE